MNRFDLTEFASMPHAEKLARSSSKRDKVLKLLSKGEVYLTTDVACELLGLSRPTALATLKKLEALGCLKTEAMIIPWNDHPRNTVLFGITPTGLAHVGADPTAPVALKIPPRFTVLPATIVAENALAHCTPLFRYSKTRLVPLRRTRRVLSVGTYATLATCV